jgi:DinB family protein
MVSEDIAGRREEYIQVIRDHGSKSRTDIVKSIAMMQNELFTLLSAVPEALAARKPAPDEWCLRELALHALVAERLIGKLVHHLARGEMPQPKDLEGARAGMIPTGDTRSYGEVLSDLRRANEELLDAVRDLPEKPNTELVRAHPFFGALNCLEWAGFQRVHDTDHIQHAKKILAATRS